jgi:FAD/FMN-containing dehydrogenase
VQYAASSYPERMRPYLIAVPRRDSDDVAAAIRFAKANKKYLVARSGGHQYSGLSSGDEGTILLSMERFKQLEIKTAGAKTVGQVGAGMLLTDLAAEFKGHGVTIPHGECPHVAIGGHAQSGGYGHLIRSYGLALDHVAEFKIYTADGCAPFVAHPPRTGAACSGACSAVARGASASSRSSPSSASATRIIGTRGEADGSRCTREVCSTRR